MIGWQSDGGSVTVKVLCCLSQTEKSREDIVRTSSLLYSRVLFGRVAGTIFKGHIEHGNICIFICVIIMTTMHHHLPLSYCQHTLLEKGMNDWEGPRAYLIFEFQVEKDPSICVCDDPGQDVVHSSGQFAIEQESQSD